MPENNKTEEFLQELASCIERGELEACVEEAARMARDMDICAEEILDLARQKKEIKENALIFVLEFAAAQGLEKDKKAEAYFNAGRAMYFSGDSKKAEEYYRKAIETNPDFAEAHNYYSQLLQKLNRIDEAIEHYKKAIEIDPKLSWAHYNYARLLKKSNKKTEAEEHYKKAIEADLKNAWAQYRYAGLLQEMKRISKAKELYEKAIETDPEFAEAHSDYAILLKELNKNVEAEEHYKKAEKLYLKAIEKKQNIAEVHSDYATLLKEFNKKDAAEEQYRQAIKADPEHIWAHYKYAVLLQELNRKNEAEEQYKKAKEIEPGFVWIHYNYANLLRQKAQLLDAEKEIRIALQIEENPYVLGTLGDILADEGLNLEEAKKAYQDALENSASMKDPAISEIHNNLGWVYAQLNQYNKAKLEFKKAIVLDPLNVKAHHNNRSLGKLGIGQEMSEIQKYLAAVVSFAIVILFAMFFIKMISETVLAAQSTILIALLIFILLFNHLTKFKVGEIEFEKSTEQRNQYIEVQR